MKKRKGFTEFQRAEAAEGEYRRLLEAHPDAESEIKLLREMEIWQNNLYQVHLRRTPTLIHLSIRRLDRRSIHDWRELQRIKSELIGPEFEAVELYPAESRHVDTSNQYHLWVAIRPDGSPVRFPFGYDDRLIMEGNYAGAKQRPFAPDLRPDDTKTANPEEKQS